MANVCPNCGFPNEPGADICKKCKIPFSEALPDETGMTEDIDVSAEKKQHSGSYIVIAPSTPARNLDMDFSDEAPPGETPSNVPIDMSRELDLGKRIVRVLPENSGISDSSMIPPEPIIMEKDDLDIDPGAMLAGRSRLARQEPTLSSVLPGIPIRDSMIESVEPADAAVEATPAGFFRRAVSSVADLVLVGTVTAAISALGVEAFGKDAGMTSGLKDPATFTGIMGPTVVPLFLVIFILYEFFFHFLTGRTPGKRLAGTMVLTTGGEALSVSRTAVRALGGIVTMITLGVGFLWIIVDEKCQALHDKIAGTLVVKDRKISEQE
jgi:uncharacterized RDD family membrane protein YckC